MKTIILSHAAARDFDALSDEGRSIVESGLTSYAMTGAGDVKKLVGRDGFRLRAGRYRVIFAEDMTTILAIYIGKRESTTYSRH